MKAKITIELDIGEEVSRILYQSPDQDEKTKPGDDDQTTDTGGKDEDEGDIRPSE